MQKQAPTLGRLLVMAGFALSCFGLLLFLWLAFGGPTPLKPKGYRFETSFGEATQLAQEADVRISGVSVGKVKTIRTGSGGRSIATVELDSRYAPLPRDSRAILRQKTLLGETYVELTPGTPGGPKLPEGGTLPASQVSPTVELDEIFRLFDEPTRRAFQTWMAQLAQGVEGRGRDISDTFGNLAPFAQDTNRLLAILSSQQGAVQRLVRNTGEVFAALTERRGQLHDLIVNSNRVFETTARRDRELRETFIALPTFEDESRLTVRRLATFARRADPLVTQLRPAARELSPTLGDLSALAPDLKGLFTDIGPLVDASVKGLPALEKFLDEARPLLGQLDPFLRNLNPALEFLGLYKRELTAFFANTVATTQATDSPPGTSGRIHYLRTTNPFNPENLAVYPRRIGTNRPNPYHLPGSFDQLTSGLPAYEVRQCGAGNPTVGAPAPSLIPQELADRINQFAFGGGGGAPAPPCRKQGKYGFGGETTDYPHVRAKPGSGAGTRRRGR